MAGKLHIHGGKITRRAALGGAAVFAAVPALARVPALADECRIGPPPHTKGPLVWMDMDQVELDAAYIETAYAPQSATIVARFASSSADVRTRLGPALGMMGLS